MGSNSLAPARWRSLWPIVVALVLIQGFFVVGARTSDYYLLDLGSILWLTPRYQRFVLLWAAFGIPAAAFLALGITRLAGSRIEEFLTDTPAPEQGDSVWILAGMAAGFLVPAAIRVFVLNHAPLTDDESAYHFAAELLASGRLRAASPPVKLFFDRAFMINDGHLYSQYFLGWPALMVPGIWLGVEGFMNAVYSALTVPAVFLVLRRLASSKWARAGVVLYLSSPMLMVAAATELSHTTCMMALAWATWCVFRSRDAGAPWWVDAAAATMFGVAFFVRPISTVGLAPPLLIWWLVGLRSRCDAGRMRRALAFALPALLLAGLFFAVNEIQNGGYLVTAYQRMREYTLENNYRFSGFTNLGHVPVLNMRFQQPMFLMLQRALVALFRLNFDLFGWPSSLLFLVFAGARRETGILWACLACFFLVHLPVADVGVDSFGPVHYSETAWPILLLTVLGIRTACRVFARIPNTETGVPAERLHPGPAAFAAAMVLCSLTGFAPVRIGAVARVADNINMPREAVRRAALHNAVVFTPRPYAPNCRSAPTRHFVFWVPTNDPDLKNDILWIEHVSLEDDRRMMDYFPKRRGYLLLWYLPCRAVPVPLDDLSPGQVPLGVIGGSGIGPDWSHAPPPPGSADATRVKPGAPSG